MKVIAIVVLVVFISFIGLLVVSEIFGPESNYSLLKKAKKEAKNYIQEKYSFTPKINSSTVDEGCDSFAFFGCRGGLTQYVIELVMEYDNKTFNVYVPLNDKKEFGKATDDYQKDEIVKGYVNYINSKTGVTPFSYEVDFKKAMHQDIPQNKTNSFHKYYNENNLNEVIDGYDISFLFKYKEDIDLANLSNLNIFNEYTYGDFIKYKSSEVNNKNYSYNDEETQTAYEIDKSLEVYQTDVKYKEE